MTAAAGLGWESCWRSGLSVAIDWAYLKHGVNWFMIMEKRTYVLLQDSINVLTLLPEILIKFPSQVLEGQAKLISFWTILRTHCRSVLMVEEVDTGSLLLSLKLCLLLTLHDWWGDRARAISLSSLWWLLGTFRGLLVGLLVLLGLRWSIPVLLLLAIQKLVLTLDGFTKLLGG